MLCADGTVYVCGENHTAALCADGTIYGCGNNGNGQLGLNDKTNRSAWTRSPLPDGVALYLWRMVCGCNGAPVSSAQTLPVWEFLANQTQGLH